jgi:potassium voltage-gated channel Eag-related subfamily H protein 8
MSFSDPRRIRWDIFVIILAIWNCFYLPFSISFHPHEPLGISIFNYFIDSMFYIDIILNFRTTFFTKDGIEVFDWKKIAFKYIFKGLFLIDILSTLPFNAFAGVILYKYIINSIG